MHINQIKEITFGDESRKKLLQGVEKLTNAVSVTMGPKGRHVLLEQDYGFPILTKDGVSVAQEIELEDHIENMGAQLVKEVSRNTANEAGDGTTTATVLAHAIFKEGLKNISAGANPIEVKRGMDKAKDEIIKLLKMNSKEITTKKEIEHVATISANSEQSIGIMISEAMDKVGKDGIITVEEAKGFEDSLEVVNGMHFDTGFMSPFFITNTEKMTVELENPLILINPENLAGLGDIVSLLGEVQKSKRPLLIITKDISQDALNTCVANKLKNILDVTVIKAPGYGGSGDDILEDISIFTGTKIHGVGETIKDIKISDLGTIEKIIISRDKTIMKSTEISEKTLQRAEQIRTLIKDSKNEYELKILKDRLSKLVGGVAVIKVGASSETELKEKKDRIDDALGATKAAVDEGIIIGGGCALIRASKINLELSGDEYIGMNIVLKAIEAPIRQIAKNAGYDDGVIINKVLTTGLNIGFNAATGEYVDMYEAGIIDSFKVARVALSNAVSVAGMLLTTEAVVSIKPKL